MGMPNFIVAGTQKAATTWLHECLNEHPEVFVPKVKEMHFYCKEPCPKSKNHMGVDWYISQFPDDKSFKAIGEISVDYMYYDYIAEDIYKFNPNMKILFILRNPVDRAYSAFWMNKRYKANMPNFTEFVKSDNQFILRGMYYTQIKRYLKFFRRDSLKILIYDDLVSHPARFICEVYDFLHVSKDFTPSSLNKSVAATKSLNPVIGFLFYKYVALVVNKVPLALSLWRFLKHNTPLSKLYLYRNHRLPPYPQINEKDRAILTNLYKEENNKLFALLNRNIPEWEENLKGHYPFKDCSCIFYEKDLEAEYLNGD